MKPVVPRLALGTWICGVACGFGSAAWANDKGVSPTVELVVLSQKNPKSVEIEGSCRALPAASVRPIRALHASDTGVRFCDESQRCETREALYLRCKDVLRIKVPNEEPRQYGHRLHARNEQGGLRLRATLHMESYVAGVVGAELGAAPLAAQDAQAILVRTFAMGALIKHRHEDAPLCDLTHCQVYGGAITGGGWRAAKRTWGTYLVSPEGKPAPVFFHSTCGGETISAHDAWPGGPPTDIVPIEDVDDNGNLFCAASPYAHWSLEVPAEQVRTVLSKLLQRDVDEQSAWLEAVDDNGLQFQVGDQKGSTKIPGSKLLRAFGQEIGWYKLKSSRFRVERSPRSFRFTGQGLGHRVGLCQFGAIERAKAGASVEEILSAYFPKLELTNSERP